MAAAKKNETTDLLDELDSGFDQEVDLLDELDKEGESVAWIPDGPGGVQGVVIARGTTNSEHSGEVPVVTIETKDGQKLRITGFQTVLRNEINTQDPKPGDTFAVKYFGKKPLKGGRGEYHHYRVAVRKAPSAA